jgi:hypothetical protein
MAINHSVIITFRRVLTQQERQALLTDANSMKGSIPEIIRLKCGFDLKLSGAETEIFSLNASFDNVEAYKTYQSHPVHKRFIEAHIQPLMVERKAVQFETID